MNFFNIKTPSPRDLVQGRLLDLAATFLFLYALVLTLSPAVRLRSWLVAYRWEHWIGFGLWLVGFAIFHRVVARLLPDRDPYLLPVAGLMTGWGLMTIYRLDVVMGLRQTLWLVFCLVVLIAALRREDLLAILRRYKYVVLTGGLLLTTLTFIFGTYPGGTGPRLWLGCCGVYLQPSEPLKLLLIVYLAAYLADRLPLSFGLLALLTPTLVLTGAALVILVAQRDLGTATLFIFLYSLIIYLASGKRRVLVVSGVAILAAGIMGYGLFDVIRIRVNAWLNPWADPAGRSYQIVQSVLAVASGGIFGTGPGIGSPGLVPVSHSDFVYAAIAEETGLLGGFALLMLIALMIGRGLRTAVCAPNNYQRFLAAGLTAYLAAQGILIVGGNLRLLPLTGVTLPFVSYGGSSLLTSFVSLLLLLIISSTAETEPAPLYRPRPYLLAGAGLLVGVIALALVNGWWSVVRSEDLQTRADNPRRFISDRYVLRGAFLDRSNNPIQLSEGEPGTYTRRSLYPPLSTTIGYTNALTGQGGLEASQDDYLRGLRGNPASLIASNALLYSTPPPGLNLRLSIALELQAQADQLLGDHRGALVLLNAASGEVLVSASHPYFDPNRLEDSWQSYLQDETAPLLNRAAQGSYSPGTALGPFLLAYALNRGNLPDLPADLSLSTGGTRFTCTQTPPTGADWGWAVSHGCPSALVTLSRRLSAEDGLLELYRQVGIFEAPLYPLPVTVPPAPAPFQNPTLAALGEENLHVSPLQMALAAAAVSSGGLRPGPRLVMAVETPTEGWVILPSAEALPALPAASVSETARLLSDPDRPYWRALGSGLTANGKVTWFLGGTLPEVQGTPLALALVLEEDNPALAEQIGMDLLQAGQQP